MTDEELVAAFESTELSGDAFTHAAHVRVAWWYLKQHAFEAALERFSVALRRFATSKGATDKYDEAITVAYMTLIAQRLHASPNASWDAFIEANEDLVSSRLPRSQASA